MPFVFASEPTVSLERFFSARLSLNMPHLQPNRNFFTAVFLCGLISSVSLGESPEQNNRRAIKVSKATLLFEEDFEQGIERWEVFDPKTWRLNTEGDSTTFEITARKSEYKPTVRSPFHVAMLKEIELGSFAITFKVRSTLDTGDHRDCCIFFGFQDREHFYYIHTGANPDRISGQILIVNGEPRAPLTKNTKPFPWTDDWHTIRVERDVDAGTIKIYFDDLSKPHIEVTDSTFGKGRIGIGSFDDMDEFDDIQIHLLK